MKNTEAAEDGRPAEAPVPPAGNEIVLPSLFRSADRASGEGQRTFMVLTFLNLAALLLAAGVGPYKAEVFDGGADLFGLVAVVAFIAALMFRTYAITTAPEKSWYAGRALAESAKSLAWRYAVGAEPFPHSGTNLEALLTERLEELVLASSDLTLEPEILDGGQITDSMRSLRAAPLNQRQQAYRVHRIHDQRVWYASKSRQHARRGRLFGYLGLASEGLGITLAVLKASLVIDVELVSFIAAAGSGLVAWERSRQDSLLAKAYSVAAHELSLIDGLIGDQASEDDWSAFVNKAEEAISREHRLWQASRGK
jgi:hypothetical protein